MQAITIKRLRGLPPAGVETAVAQQQLQQGLDWMSTGGEEAAAQGDDGKHKYLDEEEEEETQEAGTEGLVEVKLERTSVLGIEAAATATVAGSETEAKVTTARCPSSAVTSASCRNGVRRTLLGDHTNTTAAANGTGLALNGHVMIKQSKSSSDIMALKLTIN